jgi:drug/metabolite transporter (DMT)-like permease
MKDSPATAENNYAPHFALLATQVFFGSLPVIGKIVLKTIPAFGLVGFRVGIAAIVLFAFQRSRGTMRLENKGDYWRLFALSFFGVALNQILFISGLSLTKASNSSLLAVTIPIFALSVGSILGVERLRAVKIVGIVAAAIGVVLLIDPRKASFSSETTLGDLLIILNSLSYGIYVATSKETITRNGAIRSTAWLFVFASLICVPLGLFSLAETEIAAVPYWIWLLVLHIALVSTAAPYLLNAYALARVNPSTVAVYVYLQPVIGFFLAVIFLGEEVSALTVFAALLIFAGVFLATRKRQRRDAETPSF